MKWIPSTALVLLGFIIGIGFTTVASTETAMLKTHVFPQSGAQVNQGEWGEMYVYTNGETFGTTENFSAIAVIKPGQAVHPAHRHAEEEYLIITEGSGMWHVDEKEFPANKGDVLYTEPWAWHGLVNTGDTPLTFVVVKWNSKGVPKVAEPEGSHGK